ncbi:hypothetical protein LIA77_07285 [Sarocladium implicatum]|nr:hypothetical protein LIA77_07285 [Sarocladium implicatum]
MSLYMTRGEGSVRTETRVSTVFALLPTAVQSRIKPLRNIRRSISLGNITTRGVFNEELSSVRTRSEGSNTPPEVIAREAAELADQDGLQITNCGKLALRATREAGVRHRFAQQGARLIGMSLAGDEMPASAVSGDFERDAYIDGLSYLLRGLPEDLSPHERDRLRLSMPAALEVAGAHGTNQGALQQPESRPSSVYRLTNAAVVNLIIVLSLLVPYLLLLLQWLASLERKYKVSESVSHITLSVMSAVAQKATRMAETSRGSNAHVGEQVLGSVLWTMEEVTRGLSDGVDRGLSDVRARRL